MAAAGPPEHPNSIVTSQAFRDAMAHFGAAVSIVTTADGPHRFGFTATAVCSVSDTPATLLVCINRASASFPRFDGARAFCVNTLAPRHEALARLFGARGGGAERFATGRWTTGHAGVPVLEDALAAFECTPIRTLDAGSHRVLLGEVVALRVTERGDDGALFYFGRRYRALDGLPEP